MGVIEPQVLVAEEPRSHHPAQHEALEPWGGCRLCLVEITKEAWDGWSRLVTACNFPVGPDLIVKTRSDKDGLLEVGFTVSTFEAI